MYIIRTKRAASWGMPAVDHEMHVMTLAHARDHIVDLVAQAIHADLQDITYIHTAGENALPILKIGMTTTTVTKLVH